MIKKEKKPMSEPLRAISLFSGAGGMDVGFENAGIKVVFANESPRLYNDQR